jgi:hypothetical protein
VLHRFEIAGRRLALFQRSGESFDHVALKALCYALYERRYAGLEIERNLGGRYTPDVVAVGSDGRALFWGECGTVSMRKVAWLAKHSGAAEIAFTKLGGGHGFAAEARAAIDARYRPPGRVVVYGFDPEVIPRLRAHGLRLDQVEAGWYRKHDV